MLKKLLFCQFSLFLICPEFRKKLCECAIDMRNAGMTMNAVAINIGYSTCAVRYLRQRFQGTGHTDG